MAWPTWVAKGTYFTVLGCLNAQLIDRLLYQRSDMAKRAVEGQLRNLSYAHGVLAFALMWLVHGDTVTPPLCTPRSGVFLISKIKPTYINSPYTRASHCY